MKLACVQITSDDDMTVNILKAALMVGDCARAGATFVTLPENVFMMQAQGTPHRLLYTEDSHPGIVAAQKMAHLNKVWLLVGSAAVKIDDSGKAMNRSLLINPQGEITARYDKIHLFDVSLPNGDIYAESARMLQGAKAVLASVGGAKIGMSVCYDVRFPDQYRMLARAGAQILVVPSAFTVPTGEAHWHVLLRARAIENGCFVVAAAQTGNHPGGRATFGHSLIIDPWGRVLADAGTSEGIIMADIDPSQVDDVRARIPSLVNDSGFQLKDFS